MSRNQIRLALLFLYACIYLGVRCTSQPAPPPPPPPPVACGVNECGIFGPLCKEYVIGEDGCVDPSCTCVGCPRWTCSLSCPLDGLMFKKDPYTGCPLCECVNRDGSPITTTTTERPARPWGRHRNLH